ncbi:MAG: site-specific integrase [Thermoleophilaceae bacterium]|nr:site-specific integrase [Thermoleophilaceae bacterium]
MEAGRDPGTGKRLRRTETFRGTKRKAEARLTALLAAVESGTDLDPARLTLGEYLEKWLEASEKRVRTRTHERYSELARLHVAPTLGRVPLGKLRPLHLEGLYSALLAKGLSARTVLHVHRVLFSALRQAVLWQLVPRNVAEAVVPPRPARHEVAALEAQEAGAILAAVAGSDLEQPVALALGAGLRRGEVLGLRWRDLDLDAGRARVVQTLQETRGGLRFVAPKTHRSRRSVSLPAFVVDALRGHRKAQNERRLLLGTAWQPTDLVIDRGDGGPMRPDTLSHRFRKVTRRAGLDVNFHGLRHGHASLMLAAGVHLKVVSDRLGHSAIGITADLYSHVGPLLEEQAAATLDGLIGGSR